MEPLKVERELSFDEVQIPKVELKPLPPSFRYEFLGPNSTYLVIVNASLNASQVDSLLRVPREHSKDIGYTLDIRPSVCMHRIFIEDDHKPLVECQRRLDPNMQKVVKKETLKLLKVGIIYPISDNTWESLVYVIPNKRGMTVVKNENNELIPTKTVTRCRMCIDYQKLNKATRNDHFPLPFIDQMLERLAKNSYFFLLRWVFGFLSNSYPS